MTKLDPHSRRSLVNQRMTVEVQSTKPSGWSLGWSTGFKILPMGKVWSKWTFWEYARYKLWIYLTINLPPTVYIIPYSLIVLFYVYIEIRITVSTFELFSHSAKGPWNKSLSLNLVFPSEYVIPTSLKVGHWLSQYFSYKPTKGVSVFATSFVHCQDA